MTDPNLLELAKLGDPQAIAALMNQSLQSRGMNAIVDRQGECLEVILEAERVPNRQALTAFVQQGINNLGIQSITLIRIVGQQVGASYPAWMQEVQLGAPGNALSSLDELNNLAATPLNIQPETETEITAIPSDDLSENGWSERGTESVDRVDLDAADLSFLPDAELDDLATDELPDAELNSTNDMLAALTEPTVSPQPSSLNLDAWSESEIAPDFLQELLADSEGADRSLFAESPDGSLETLEGSPTEDLGSDSDLDLFFSDFESGSETMIQPETEPLPDLFALSEEASDEASGELDADLLDFLDQPDRAYAADAANRETQPQDFSIDAFDPADNRTTNLNPALEAASSPELADLFPAELFNDAEISEATAVPLPDAAPTSPSDSDRLLSSQIEELFDAEIDQPDSGYIEETLPERPTDTAEDLRQALVNETPPAESAPELSDPWTVQVLPELSEARTVLDLPDDEPNEDLPAFMVEPRPDSPDAAIEPNALEQPLAEDAFGEVTDPEAANDLDALFADSEEPPVSTMPEDSSFYGSIADEEIAEEDLEELPPDFLQDFAAEFPDGFPNDFSEAEPVGEPSAAVYPDAPSVSSLNDFLTEPDPPASGDLAAELAALDLTPDSEPSEPISLEPPPAESTTAFELEAVSVQPNFELASLDERTEDEPDDFTPLDLNLAPADPDLADLEQAESPDLNAGSDADLDADLADLLSETPQGTVISDATPADTSPQPEDFFLDPIASDPIAPDESPLAAEAGSTIASDTSSGGAGVTEPLDQPEVSQDVLEAGLGDFREGFVEPLPEEFFVDAPHPSETDWQADLRDPLDLTDDTEANYVIEDSTPAVVYTPPPLPDAEKAPDRSAPAWLFPLVLLFVVAWIAGLLGFALFRSRFDPLPSPPPAGESPDVSPSPPPTVPAPPAPPTSQQPSPSSVANLTQGTPLKSAVEQASDAVALAQAAQSADDWGLVASKWQQAVNLLKTIPNTSPDYATAQQKLADYTANVSTARQKANLPIVAAAPLGVANVAQADNLDASPNASPNASPTTSPTATAAGVVCNAVASAPNSQPVELSRVQFDPTVDQAQSSPLVGCITNHTEQPIAAVNVAYKNSTSAAATTGNLNFSQLDPKQTVPFKSVFTVTPQVKNLTIASIFWTAAGASQAQELPATINVARGNEDG